MNVLCHAISAIIWTLHRSNSGALCTMATVRTCKTRSRCSTLPGQYRAPGQGDGPRNGGSGTRLGDRGAVRARQHRASASAGPEAPQESFQTDGISAHPKNPKNVCCFRTARSQQKVILETCVNRGKPSTHYFVSVCLSDAKCAILDPTDDKEGSCGHRGALTRLQLCRTF